LLYSAELLQCGVGKSHLAMSTAWEVLEKSNYDKRCLFISYAELLEQLKFAMKDEQARKTITGTLMAEIKSADLVVLDDLGAELGVKGNDSTNFNNDTLNRIVEARQNKATVLTTASADDDESVVLEEMSVKELREYAKRNDIEIPSAVRVKAEILNIIKESE
jgi:DNA replication protein DnaC